MLVVLSATHQHESVIILYICIPSLLGLPKGLSGKASTCQCRSHGEFSPWIRKIPWRRKWQPAPVFLPGKFRGQRSWAGYNPRGHKESDKPAWLSTHMVPSLLSLPPPPSLSLVTGRRAGLPVLRSSFLLAICFPCDRVYMSVLLSHFVSPSAAVSSSSFSISESPFL